MATKDEKAKAFDKLLAASEKVIKKDMALTDFAKFIEELKRRLAGD